MTRQTAYRQAQFPGLPSWSAVDVSHLRAEKRGRSSGFICPRCGSLSTELVWFPAGNWAICWHCYDHATKEAT